VAVFHGGVPPGLNLPRYLGLFLGRQFKGKLFPEAPGFPDAEEDTRGHPDRTIEFSGTAEIQPERQANEKAQYGWH